MKNINLVEELDRLGKYSIKNDESDLLEMEKFVGHIKNTFDQQCKIEQDIMENITFVDSKKIEEYTNFKTQFDSKDDFLSKIDLTKYPLGKIVKKEDIKKICLRYNLKCRPLNSKEYLNTIDTTVAIRIRTLSEELHETHLSVLEKCYIVAPVENFKVKLVSEKDPLVFFQIPNKNTGKETEYYFLLHKWGNDFTIKRRFSGIINKNKFLASFYALIYTLSVVLIPLFSIFLFLNKFSAGFHRHYISDNGWTYIPFLIIGILWTVLVLISVLIGVQNSSFHNTKENWNTNNFGF